MSEQNKKIDLVLPASYNGDPIVVEWREGKAPNQIDDPILSKVKEEGIITAPEAYVFRNYETQILSKSLCEGIITYSVNPNNMFIRFDENPSHPVSGAIITGKASVNPEIIEWGINKHKKFSAKVLINTIRAQAHNMQSKEKAQELIKLLQNFEARFVTERKRADDRKGNTEDAFKQTLQVSSGEMPSELLLNIPIFMGGEPVALKLDIEIDQEDGDIVYSFYSLEYGIQLREAAKNAINASVDKMRPAFVCIEKP